MTITVAPAASFEHVRLIVGPKSADATGCWCLTYRNRRTEGHPPGPLTKPDRMAALCRRDLAPGVLAYDGDEPVGWAAVAPRQHTTFAYNEKFPRLDPERDDIWSLWCLKVRPGRRGAGLAGILLGGAVDFARRHGAAVVEAYPLDNQGARVALGAAYAGTRTLFERAGFRQVADTTSVLDGFPRIVMRLDA